MLFPASVRFTQQKRMPHQARQILLPSRLYYAKIVTDFSDKLLLDLAMSGNRGRCAVERVAKDSVLRAFPNEDAAVRFYVPDEVGSFHNVNEI